MTTPPDRSRADTLDRSWDANAQAWTAAVREGRIASRRIATDRAIVDAVLECAPSLLLDAGCGEGWLCRALRTHGVHCIGVDGSADLVRAARSADPEGDYHRLPYEDFDDLHRLVQNVSPDTAVFNFALLHEDIHSILRAVHRTLRPRGTLLIQTVHPWMASDTSAYINGWRTEDFAGCGGSFPEAMPWYFRTLESWVSTVHGCGFTIDRLTEPLHPETGRPLSLLLSAVRSGE